MRITTLLLLIGLIGCTSEPKQKPAAIWFDLPGLIDELVLNMAAKNHRIIKTFSLNKESETKQYDYSDSIFWTRELVKLREIDLNSPQIRDVLKMSVNIKDDKSNLLIDEYLLQNKSLRPNMKISIYYLADISEIRQIYAELYSDNLIANSRTKINLWVNRYNEKLLIDSLQIIGRDKTLMQPLREYQISISSVW